MAAFNVFKQIDDEDDEGSDPSTSSASNSPAPPDVGENSVPDVTNPEGATPQLDTQDQDLANIVAAKQKMRTGKAPAGNPGVESGVTIPAIAPDSILAGLAAGPISSGLSGAESSAANAISPEVKAASIAAKNKLMQSLGKHAFNVAEEVTPYEQVPAQLLAYLKQKSSNQQ
jgi:hypothetical protein